MMKTQISIIKTLAIAMTLAALLVATFVQAAPRPRKPLRTAWRISNIPNYRESLAN